MIAGGIPIKGAGASEEEAQETGNLFGVISCSCLSAGQVGAPAPSKCGVGGMF